MTHLAHLTHLTYLTHLTHLTYLTLLPDHLTQLPTKDIFYNSDLNLGSFVIIAMFLLRFG